MKFRRPEWQKSQWNKQNTDKSAFTSGKRGGENIQKL